MCKLSCFGPVRLFATIWIVAHQAPLSMGFSKWEAWSGLPCPPPGDLPHLGIDPLLLSSPALAGRFFTTCGSANKRIHLQYGRPGFDPWVGKIPWRRKRLPTPELWPGEFRGLYSSWGCKEADTTEWLSLTHSLPLAPPGARLLNNTSDKMKGSGNERYPERRIYGGGRDGRQPLLPPGSGIWSQFSSVQFSRSVVSDSLRPHELQHARPPCPSPTPGVHSDSCPSSLWCHPAISSSVVPFSSCPQSLPALPKLRGEIQAHWPLYTSINSTEWSFELIMSISKCHV